MPEEIIQPENTNSIQDPALLSYEVKEIISNKPVWLVRNGIMLFFLILCVLTGFTFLIRYPDVITARGKLVSVNPPKEVKTRTDGKLIKLFVTEGMPAEKDMVLGYMESRANAAEVTALAGITDSVQHEMETGSIERLPSFYLQSYTQLGEVQQQYQKFTESLILFKQYLANGFFTRKKAMLKTDLAYIEKQHANLLEQKELQAEDLSLAGQTFSANRTLSDQKVISAFDFRNEQSKLIGKKLTIPQLNSLLLGNESAKQEKLKEIMQLENDIAQQKTIFIQSLNTFKAALEDWKSKYVLSAPVAGIISFSGIIRENQQLENGRSICFISPQDTKIFAEIQVPQANFGKAAIGQEVIINLPSYPSQEFGELKGRLDYIYFIPTDSGFNARVVLPDKLITTYNKTLQYREGLAVTAGIVTKNLKLSSRIFNGLRNLTDNH